LLWFWGIPKLYGYYLLVLASLWMYAVVIYAPLTSKQIIGAGADLNIVLASRVEQRLFSIRSQAAISKLGLAKSPAGIWTDGVTAGNGSLSTELDSSNSSAVRRRHCPTQSLQRLKNLGPAKLRSSVLAANRLFF